MVYKLKVFLNGVLQSELLLSEGQEYIAGRSKAADIILNNKAGISRQHFKIFFDGQNWKLETLSQFGGLTLNGKEFTEHTFTESMTFLLNDFQFEFLAGEAQNTTNSPEQSVSQAFTDQDNNELSNIDSNPEPSLQFENGDSPNFADGPDGLQPNNVAPTNFTNNNQSEENSSNLEKTSIAQMGGTDAGQSPIKAFLKINDSNGNSNEIFRLDGEYWVVGRSPNCEIYLNNKNVSRKHIAIERKGKKYFVSDLGSSNGTSLNGETMVAKSEDELKSGDKLQVKSLTFEFEMRNTNFDRQLESIDSSKLPAMIGGPAPGYYPQSPAPYGGMTPYNIDPQAQKVVKISPKSGGFPKSKDELVQYVKANKLRAGLFVAIPIIFFKILSGSPQGKVTQTSKGPKITAEQEKQMANMFKIAKVHLDQQRPQLCIDQIAAIHRIDANYSSTKEVLNYCVQQKENLEKIREQQALEENARIVKKQVETIIQKCESRMTKMDIEGLNKCLEPAVALDPENEKIKQIMVDIETRMSLKADLEREKRERESRIQDGRSAYNRAKSSKKNSSIKKSISLYQQFLNGGYPELNKEKSRAKRAIASLQSKLDSKIKTYLASCEASISSEKYVDALKSCKAVIKEDRSNKKARELIKRASKNLENVVKSLYQDGVFEASVGNIEAAKAKWKKVIEVSYPKETYYERSKSKLAEVGAIL